MPVELRSLLQATPAWISLKCSQISGFREGWQSFSESKKKTYSLLSLSALGFPEWRYEGKYWLRVHSQYGQSQNLNPAL